MLFTTHGSRNLSEDDARRIAWHLKALPHGFSTIVVERLSEKGITITARTVQNVANGKHRNPDIEAELLDLIENPPIKEKPKSDFEIKLEEMLAKKGL